MTQLSILIVDDSVDDREFISDLLEEDAANDWRVIETAESGEGLELVKEHHFDCVLLDYSMPGENGVQVLSRLRENNIEAPVIMLTGQGSERIAVEAMKAGAQDYVPKSELSLDRLREVVFEAIDRKSKELELVRRANYDHLTGLAGRLLFRDRLQRASARAARHESVFAVVYLDLDGFKPVNDELGHQAGDLLLKEVANRLITNSREGDTAARLGGDEFALIFEDLQGNGIESTTLLLRRISQALADTYYAIDGRKVELGASLGAAIYPTTSRDPKRLLTTADHAMYAAKRDPAVDYKIAATEKPA